MDGGGRQCFWLHGDRVWVDAWIAMHSVKQGIAIPNTLEGKVAAGRVLRRSDHLLLLAAYFLSRVSERDAKQTSKKVWTPAWS
eukprot:7602774-Pyramimonas_sp.AAC.1